MVSSQSTKGEYLNGGSLQGCRGVVRVMMNYLFGWLAAALLALALFRLDDDEPWTETDWLQCLALCMLGPIALMIAVVVKKRWR